MLLALAWKNIWRNKKRSLIILTAIALGLWAGLFSVAISMGVWEATVNATIDRNLSHIQIHTKEFKEEKLISNYIPDGNSILDQIRKDGRIKEVSGRVLIEGMASSPTSSGGVNIVGVNPDRESIVTTISNYIKEGTFFETNKRNPIVVGQKLADKLGLKLGSKIVLTFQNVDTTLTYAAFRIVGIFKTESSIFDQLHLFVNKSDLYPIMESKPIISEIAIRLNSSEELDSVYSTITQKHSSLMAETWKQLAPELEFTYEMLILELEIFLGIILAALLFGITNTMLMSVMDRVREFGVLMAVGMKRIRVFFLILIETFVLSIFGGIIGMGLGAITVWYLSDKGIDLSIFAEGLNAWGMPTQMYPMLPIYFYFVLVIMIIVTAIIAAIYPSIKTIKLRPAEAIRTY
ncbi:MAG: ABC transporter permease [Ignavibacteria bacterium]|nr:ABC transporter permease [Ignavibacteria bacterium]MBT8382795.1 ABC transporter permease [Ignavibacteria bacterium]MBT8392682.1 ABC transporter permease [Ignavibacteria bacterium]NNJ52538.1 ABC transporter permease [Ignavibacteriaceae bacterium]NNL21983.1 ABC transporter permease [Ignavibacteriaceae bacterium]